MVSMPTAAETARSYFDAAAARDPEAMASHWAPGKVDHLVGMSELEAPDGVRAYFAGLFEAFPDFRMEVVDLIAEGSQAAVRWHATGTFNGTGKFEGISPNGARLEITGCDVLTIEDGKIVSNFAYLNGTEVARQLGVMPEAGSPGEKAMMAAANAKIAAGKRVRSLLDR